jgi:hypothetical protein
MKRQKNSQSGVQSESILNHFTAVCREKIQGIKENLKNRLQAEFGHVLDAAKIQQVINEADALATYTPFPALFLPTLAEEKALAVVSWQGKQQLVRASAVNYALAA